MFPFDYLILAMLIYKGGDWLELSAWQAWVVFLSLTYAYSRVRLSYFLV